MKTLTIIESPYRGTLEEQDDAALWLTQAVANVGGEFGVLLCSSAVNYATSNQDPTGMEIGGVSIEHPCHPDRDLAAMHEKGTKLWVVREDLEERGISMDTILKECEPISRSQVADVVRQYDQVWHF